jgi:hypothetical protein
MNASIPGNKNSELNKVSTSLGPKVLRSTIFSNLTPDLHQKKVMRSDKNLFTNFRDINLSNNARNYKTQGEFKKRYVFKNLTKQNYIPSDSNFARYLDSKNIALLPEDQGSKIKEDIKTNINYLIESLNKNKFQSDSQLNSDRESDKTNVYIRGAKDRHLTGTNKDLVFEERKLNKEYYRQKVEYLTKTMWNQNPNVITSIENTGRRNEEVSSLKLPVIGNIQFTKISNSCILNSRTDSERKETINETKNQNSDEVINQEGQTVNWSKYNKIRQMRQIFAQN